MVPLLYPLLMVLGLTGCTPSMEITEKQSKLEGEMCEAPDGFLRDVVAMPLVTQAVDKINAARKIAYQNEAMRLKTNATCIAQKHFEHVKKYEPCTICKPLWK